MKIKEFLEGFKERGTQDGTGPFKDSAMASGGKKGAGAGRGKGKCPKRKDFDSDKEFMKALRKWKKDKGV